MEWQNDKIILLKILLTKLTKRKGLIFMALMTGEQYIESIKKIKMRIYMFGKEYETAVGNPILQPSLNSLIIRDMQTL